ncbi:MAG TPA: hypothetical protein VI248_00700 [Kineosporiaceae bacterium]
MAGSPRSRWATNPAWTRFGACPRGQLVSGAGFWLSTGTGALSLTRLGPVQAGDAAPVGVTAYALPIQRIDSVGNDGGAGGLVPVCVRPPLQRGSTDPGG